MTIGLIFTDGAQPTRVHPRIPNQVPATDAKPPVADPKSAATPEIGIPSQTMLLSLSFSSSSVGAARIDGPLRLGRDPDQGRGKAETDGNDRKHVERCEHHALALDKVGQQLGGLVA